MDSSLLLSEVVRDPPGRSTVAVGKDCTFRNRRQLGSYNKISSDLFNKQRFTERILQVGPVL